MSILVIDIGSSKIKAAVSSNDGVLSKQISIKGAAVSESETIAEIDGEETCRRVLTLIRQLNEGLQDSIDAISFSCLGTTMIPTGSTGLALAPGISPLDKRSIPYINRISHYNLSVEELYEATGQNPGVASFLHQYLWMREHRASILSNASCFLSVRGLIISRLCGVNIEDHSWASRTMLYDLKKGTWSNKILDKIGLDIRQLPDIVSSTATFPIRKELVKELGLSDEALAVAGGLDNCCGFAGSGAEPNQNDLVNVVGTYEHLSCLVPIESASSLAIDCNAFAFRSLFNEKKAVVCSRNSTGYMLNRLKQVYGDRIPSDLFLHDITLDPCDLTLSQNDFQSEDISALSDCDPYDAVAALLEASCFMLRIFLEKYESVCGPAKRIIVIGGGAVMSAALQKKANILGKTLVLPENPQAAVLGACETALIGSKECSVEESKKVFLNRVECEIVPQPKFYDKFDSKYKEFKKR